MRILLFDTTAHFPASPLFLEALEELAREERHEFVFVDEGTYLQPLKRWLVHKIAYRALGRRPLSHWRLNRDLLSAAIRLRPDVVLIVKGAHIAPGTLRQIKAETGSCLVNYATDDPFNPKNTTRDLVAAIPCYDLYACTKRAVMPDLEEAGCKHVSYVRFGYKPTVHFPEKPRTEEEKARFASDVVFVGTCDQDRIPYFEALVEALPGIRLQLYGGYWERHSLLKRCHRGFALGRDYRLALGGAKIAVNVVRRANRDTHTLRTFEIPACGAFMLAERTEEHEELFEEGVEAAFFGSPQELVEKVRRYLSHDVEREQIAHAGRKKVIEGACTYMDRLKELVNFTASCWRS